MDDQLDRLGVQLAEARRMAHLGGVPRGRIALLLLDNAAETLLRFSAEHYLSLADFYGNLVRQAEPLMAAGHTPPESFEKIRAKVVSVTRRRKIDRDFNALVDYVFEHDDWMLGQEFSSCLKILHRYRNSAYHRDKISADVLDPAIVIYFYLVAHLMLHRKSMMWLIDDAPPGVVELLDGEDMGEGFIGSSAHSSSNYQAAMADKLLRDFVPDPAAVSEALSRHMLARLEGIERDLKEIGEYFGVPGREREFAIRVIQCTHEEWRSSEPPSDFWTRKIGVDEKVIQRWKYDAQKLRDTKGALQSLRIFADQELALSAFEANAAELALEVDRAIQHEIDLRRGK